MKEFRFGYVEAARRLPLPLSGRVWLFSSREIGSFPPYDFPPNVHLAQLPGCDDKFCDSFQIFIVPWLAFRSQRTAASPPPGYTHTHTHTLKLVSNELSTRHLSTCYERYIFLRSFSLRYFLPFSSGFRTALSSYLESAASKANTHTIPVPNQLIIRESLFVAQINGLLRWISSISLVCGHSSGRRHRSRRLPVDEQEEHSASVCYRLHDAEDLK